MTNIYPILKIYILLIIFMQVEVYAPHDWDYCTVDQACYEIDIIKCWNKSLDTKLFKSAVLYKFASRGV